MMKQIRYVLLISVVVLSACNSLKKVGGSGVASRAITAEKVVAKVLEQQPEYRTVQVGKLSTTVRFADKKFTVGGAMNYVADSLLTFSIQPLLGIELFRMEMIADHVTVIDKMKRRYVQVSHREMTEHPEFKKMEGKIDMRSFEGLFAAHLFSVGDVDYFKKTFKAELAQDGEQYVLRFVDSEVMHEFSINKTTFAVEQVRLSMAGGDQFIVVTYTDRRVVNEVVVPTRIVMEGTIDGNSGTCEMNLTRLTINEPIRAGMTDLRRYRRMDIEEVMKEMGNTSK